MHTCEGGCANGLVHMCLLHLGEHVFLLCLFLDRHTCPYLHLSVHTNLLQASNEMGMCWLYRQPPTRTVLMPAGTPALGTSLPRYWGALILCSFGQIFPEILVEITEVFSFHASHFLLWW